MQTQLAAAQGEFTLYRYPRQSDDTLRAWDAGDELLLSHINHLENPIESDDTHRILFPKAPRVLIINDQFGALSCALNHFKPVVINDSFIAQQAIAENIKANKLNTVKQLAPLDKLEGVFDLVVIKIHKSLAQLEDLLHKIRPHLKSDSLIIGSGMVKMIHNSTLNLFSNILGPTTTSLAKKKARLIFCQKDEALQIKDNPFPSSFTLDDGSWKIQSHANVFSQGKLDIGCRFFIENLPSKDNEHTIIDLGCGNGLVGLTAAKLNPHAQIAFYDESTMAVASAKLNYETIFPSSNNGHFHVDDCLSHCSKNSADIVLNNPPFHEQNVVSDAIAWRMFKQSFDVLKHNGELWVVGNRHLNYGQKLKKLFGNCQTVATNNKFVVIKAIKYIKPKA
jgi:16S rRNA (guanine1207-N2)-methyltransferase